MDFWLTSDIYSWVTSTLTSDISQGKEWFCAYEIWKHADLILQQKCDKFHLNDAITNLKRAVDHRLILLNKLYKLKRIPIKEKPSERLQLLYYLDIVRPIMVEKLIQIRNAVEHEHASPPDYEACKIFSEFIWYFLRSTDNLVREIVFSFSLHPAKSEINLYSVECEMGIEQGWNPTIGGWVPSHLISYEFKDRWLKITGEKSTSTSDYFINFHDSQQNEGDQGKENGNRSKVTTFNGEIRGPADCLKRLFQLYFKVI